VDYGCKGCVEGGGAEWSVEGGRMEELAGLVWEEMGRLMIGQSYGNSDRALSSLHRSPEGVGWLGVFGRHARTRSNTSF
jgi:hypothetical protein